MQARCTNPDSGLLRAGISTIFSRRRAASTLPRQAAFTLVELMVVIAIILVLAGLVTTVSQTCRKSAEKIREVSAAKNLLAAYSLAAADRDGMLLRGYDRTSSSITLPDGTLLTGPAAQRYPYRLAGYFSYEMEGTILVNNNARQINAKDTYYVSCFPAFGMNYYFVGGDFQSNGVQSYPGECVNRLAQAAHMLVFASAGSKGTIPDSNSSDSIISGFCILTPPNLTTQMWSGQSWKKEADPGLYGQIDARYDGKAVCGFLDGSVASLSIEELRDMRLWNRNALEQNNASYVVPY